MLFDADGVLQGVRAGWLDELTAAGGERGEEFVLAVFAAERSCLTGQDFAAAMQEVLDQFEIDRPLSEVIDPEYWIQVDPAMVAAVSVVRSRGLSCGLATNQQNLRGAHMRGTLYVDGIFDAQFYSWELGFAKPDPDYFRAIVERVDGRPERMLFIDDNAANVEGAREVGLRAELFPAGGGVAALAPLLAAYGIVLA